MNGPCAQSAATPSSGQTLKSANLLNAEALSTGSRRNWLNMALWVGVAGLSFHVAYAWRQAGFFVIAYLFALAQLARLDTWRKAFYSGLAVGLLIAGGRLDFFWTIFS